MINKDFNLYVYKEKVMIIITPMNIHGEISFEINDGNLLIKNKKQNYLINIGKTNIELLKNNKGLLVETGNGKLIAEYDIQFS